ncbi:MAG TPA: hypothetical protein VNW52_10185 [Burkholderiaceae bacterium]|jgi:hypothetical protein|nr:hypothetical protein [Burkholderiaceae bacterium]
MKPQFREPDFINVQVTVLPVREGHGTEGKHKHYKVTCTPREITVIYTNTVINYQIIPETPLDIVFHGMKKKHPSHILQLSHPSISIDRKMMTFSDLCSVPEQIHITLEFRDRDGSEIEYDHAMNFDFDPQVGNEPEIGH